MDRRGTACAVSEMWPGYHTNHYEMSVDRMAIGDVPIQHSNGSRKWRGEAQHFSASTCTSNGGNNSGHTNPNQGINKGVKGKPLKQSETLKQDYIHVRARRGQATDNHSLAERARREKISERMKILQDLVPGCTKVTGKALVLDEIINYIQSLQRQVEFLSMKLEAVNSRMGMDQWQSKELPHQTFIAPTIALDSQNAAREYGVGPAGMATDAHRWWF